MQNKIVVITSHYLYQPTTDALNRLRLNCKIIVVPYDNFEHISQVYDSYADEADGFLVSGKSAADAIRLAAQKPMKPLLIFQANIAGLYKSLLQLFLEKRDLDTSRVVLDFLLPVEGGYTAEDFLNRSEVESVDARIGEWVKQTGVQEIGGVENAILAKLIELWDNGRMDIVVCLYGSIVPALEQYGIPYRYPFLSDVQLEELVHELESKIELEKMRLNLPAIVSVVPKHADSVTEEQFQTLNKQLTQYFRDHLVECMVQTQQGRSSVITTLQAVRIFTNHGTNCGLSVYLKDKLDFDFVVSYGIGSDINDAQTNAQAAIREALFTGHSYIKDESGKLIGPLGSENQIAIENHPIQDVGLIAKQCNLSSMTIQKMLTHIKMSGSNLITTQELSKRFGVTVRNANRILSNLKNGGYAQIVYSQTTSSKGRPVKVYELNFNIT